MKKRLKRLAMAAAVLAAGYALWVLFWPLPAPVQAAGGAGLDVAMPVYHFNDIHHRAICAAPETILKAVEEVRISEIALAKAMFDLRQLRRSPSTAAQRPLLQAALAMNFVPLVEAPGAEIVYGTAGPFWKLRPGPDEARRFRAQLADVRGAPERFAALEVEGAAKAAIQFRIEPVLGRDCPDLVTETRIYCPRREDLRTFSRYWRVIYPGSALLRETWLAAIEKRAAGKS